MTIKVDPMGAPRMTRKDKWQQRPCVVRYRAFKDVIRYSGIKDLPQPCRMVFRLAMPESWSKRKRQAMVDTPHQVRPDIDNLQKGVLDALYGEDGHIWSVWAEKRWAEEGSIEVVPLAISSDVGK